MNAGLARHSVFLLGVQINLLISAKVRNQTEKGNKEDRASKQ